MTDICKFCGTSASIGAGNCTSLEGALAKTDTRPYGCPWFNKEDREFATKREAAKLSREGIAKTIYDVSTDWLIRGGMPANLLCSFDKLGDRDRNLHLAYADAVLSRYGAPTQARAARQCDGADDLDHLDGMFDDRERGA